MPFSISQNEAIDIDSKDDLKKAEVILQKIIKNL